MRRTSGQPLEQSTDGPKTTPSESHDGATPLAKSGKLPTNQWRPLLVAAGITLALIVLIVLTALLITLAQGGGALTIDVGANLVAAMTAVVGLALGAWQVWTQSRERDAQVAAAVAARQRVEDADERLQQSLEQLAKANHKNAERNRREEALLLGEVWHVVTSRLGQYHQDALEQGRRAFNSAMKAMGWGFTLLLACGATAVFLAPTTTSAVVMGGLGAVSAAVAGFVSRTYLRTYQEASTHLRAYFAQPVEASRHLSAERAIAVSGLPDESRADLMRVLVQAMVAPINSNGAAAPPGGTVSTGSQ